MAIRNKGNLTLSRQNGTIIRKNRRSKHVDENDYMICSKCKGYFKNTYIVRHSKNCYVSKATDEAHQSRT